MAMQFKPSGVQMVGRLPGIVTTAPAGATGPLTGMAALAFATVTLALALASSALALAFAAAAVLALVWRCNLSSFSSSRRNCCRSSAISESLPADCAWACEANSAPIRPIAVATPDFVLDMRTSPFTLDLSSPSGAKGRRFRLQREPVVQLEKFRRWRRRWLVEIVDDAGINLCPLGNAAIASRPRRQENSRMLYRSHKRGRSRGFDDDRHIGKGGSCCRRGNTARGKPGSSAKEGRPPFYWGG